MDLMDLPRRNSLAVEQALRQMQTEVNEQHVRINELMAMLSTIVSKMQALEQIVVTYRVERMGHGPTV